jgi:hypothetical protein
MLVLSPFKRPAALALSVAAVAWAGCNDPSGPDQDPIRTIVISGAPASPVVIGQTVQLTATAFDSNEVEVPTTFEWLTSNAEVAEVSSTGLVTVVAPGDVGISAVTPRQGAALLQGAAILMDARERVTITSAGGLLTMLDGMLMLTIPAGGVSGTTELLVRPFWDIVNGVVSPMPIVLIGPEGIGFDGALTLRYVPGQFAPWERLDSLRLYRVQDSAWVLVQSSEVDTEAKTVSAAVSGTGVYGIRVKR